MHGQGHLHRLQRAEEGMQETRFACAGQWAWVFGWAPILPTDLSLFFDTALAEMLRWLFYFRFRVVEQFEQNRTARPLPRAAGADAIECRC